MEIRDSSNVNGKGLFATEDYTEDEVVFVLAGEIFDHPTRESIHIGNNKHIYDHLGIYINHSFEPTIYIEGLNVVAKRDIKKGDELMFNYNESEINMASPFLVGDVEVKGNSVEVKTTSYISSLFSMCLDRFSKSTKDTME